MIKERNQIYYVNDMKSVLISILGITLIHEPKETNPNVIKVFLVFKFDLAASYNRKIKIVKIRIHCIKGLLKEINIFLHYNTYLDSFKDLGVRSAPRPSLGSL